MTSLLESIGGSGFRQMGHRRDISSSILSTPDALGMKSAGEECLVVIRCCLSLIFSNGPRSFGPGQNTTLVVVSCCRFGALTSSGPVGLPFGGKGLLPPCVITAV